MRLQQARRLNAAFSFLVLVSMLIGMLRMPLSAAAQTERLQDGLRIDYSDETGRASFIGADPGKSFQLQGVAIERVAPLDRPMLYLQNFAPLLGLRDPGRELQQEYSRTHDGRSTTRYQQIYEGVPVLAGELIVNLDRRGGLLSISGEISPDLSLSTVPEVTASAARESAIAVVAKAYGLGAAELTATEPELWIYDQRLLRPSTRHVELVWRMDVAAADGLKPIRELVLVNAVRGGISLHFNQIDTSWAAAQDEPVETPAATPTPTIEPTPTLMPNLPGDSGEELNEPFAGWGEGDEYYVKPGGDDGLDCDTPADACETINGAMGKAASGDTIFVASGTYTGSAEYVVTFDKNLLLSGGWEVDFSAQTGFSTIDGQHLRKGVGINAGVTSEIEYFLIENGYATGSVTTGGGIMTAGNLTMRYCIVNDNSASYHGGGVYQEDGTLIVENSEISQNDADVYGGGFYLAGGTAEIRNSTISDNISDAGGGLFNMGTLTLNNVTIADNLGVDNGGGIFSGVDGTITMSNTVLADNFTFGTGPDCSAPSPIVSLGYNLLEVSMECDYTPALGDITGVDIYLNPLEGAPAYHSFDSDCGLVDAGNPATPGSGGGACEPTDQRGLPRPFDGDDNGSILCDIGAFELMVGDPASVEIYSGSLQRAQILSTFDESLKARVFDEFGLPLSAETVTFSAPETGASGTFSDSGTNETTAVTDESGVATAAEFTANDSDGSYIVEATVSGVATPAEFSLENYIPVATSIAVNDGSGQIAPVSTIFSEPLQALVQDQYGIPMAGASVTFTAPASGASGTFADSLTNVTTAVTDANGLATSADFTANGEAGIYTVEAAVIGIATPAEFSLENVILVPTSIVAVAGSNQYAEPLTTFPIPFEVTVEDQFGDPYEGATVTFTAPSSGASGTFADSLTYETTAVTDSNGTAIAADFTANDQVGDYSVFATVSGIPDPAVFDVNNRDTLVWYVSPDGEDTRECLQPATACATIEGVLGKPGFFDGDIIWVESGIYTKSDTQVVYIDREVDIHGGWNADFTLQTDYSTIDCGDEYRWGILIDSVTVMMNHMIVEGCERGGIRSSGTAYFENLIVRDNLASGNIDGGGIQNTNYMELRNSSIRGNTGGDGGGVYIQAGATAIIENCFIQDNTSLSIYEGGGGIYNWGTLTVANSTISHNTAQNGGGIYTYVGNTTTVNNTTITNNTASYNYGGGLSGEGHVTFVNSIVAGNLAPVDPDCHGSFTESLGYSILGFPDGCSFTMDDIISVDPYLVSELYNGGPDLIFALMPGSPAVDAANPASPGSGGNACLATDQRGVSRPLDGDEDLTPLCDMGAYELDPADPPTIPDPGPEGARRTFTSQNTDWLPGSFLCDQTQASCTDGSIPHADAAHSYAGDTYAFYASHHGRDSFDDAGGTIISSVHVGEDYANAAWTGLQMIYGDAYGFPLADDVVAHELTHGVTDYASNLYYYYQSGAINESFSDLWGEFVDLTNGEGNDDPGVRWLMGEDVAGYGASRDMADPTTFGDPDRMTSPNYYTGSADLFDPGTDNGGVHTNSGVNNKAVYLMTDGDDFNGQTVTGLGIDKVAAIYYEVQTNLLTSGSDYGDLYNALYQGCLNLVGGAEGITPADCTEVQQAATAVEMDQEPVAGYNPEAAVCDVSESPVDLFFDDLESGSANWSFGVLSGTASWYHTTGYATSGIYILYGSDYPVSSDTYVAMDADIPLDVGSQPYLHFTQAFGFEDPDWDGGWLEYSTDGGGIWEDAGPLFDGGLDYTGAISTGFDNPNAGHVAFVGDSHGFVSSRYDLSSLAGQSVRFRWRMSTDSAVYDLGWLIDDVRIYTCVEGNIPPNVPNTPDPVDDAGDVPIDSDLNWNGGDGDGDPVTYDVYLEADDANPGVLVCDDVSSTTCDPGELAYSTTYYWYVEAWDGEDTTPGPIWDFTTSAPLPVELLLNTDLEVVVPSPWKGANLETVDGSDCGTAHGGSCSAALTGSSGGETKMLFYGLPGFSGSAGDTFNLSYYNRRDSVGGAGAVQVRVSLRYTDATMGHFSYVPGVGTADWELLSHDFSAAKDYDWGVVRLIFSKPNGTLWYDDMSLMRNGSEELLDNGDMEIRVPSMWKGDKLTLADGSDCIVAHSGTCSAALTGTTGNTKMLFYGIPGLSGSAGDEFTLSYYNRRDSVGGAGAVQVRVSIRYTDATMGHFSFVPGVGTADWEQFIHTFTAAKDYDWGVIRLIFSKPNGTLWYDEISLQRTIVP